MSGSCTVSTRSSTRDGGRPDPPAGRRDLYDRRAGIGVRGQGRQPPRFRWSFWSEKTRPNWVLSATSRDRPAILPASMCSLSSWRQSGWNCCISWCPAPFVLPSSSTPPTCHRPRLPYEKLRRRLAPSACKPRFLRPTRRVRSNKSQQRLGSSDPMRYSWGPHVDGVVTAPDDQSEGREFGCSLGTQPRP